MNFEQKDNDRFWSKVDKSGDCWIWTAYKCNRGYGQWGFGGKVLKAHRVSYTLANGHISNGTIMHKCDNPSCVNPDHLIDGTPAMNAADRDSKGRHYHSNTKNCKRGHPLTRVSYLRTRLCRICKASHQARYNLRDGLFNASLYLFEPSGHPNQT